MGENLGECFGGINLEARDARCRGVAAGGRENGVAARLARRDAHRQLSPHAAKASVQGQLAHEGQPLSGFAIDRTGGAENADGDGQVETRPALAKGGRGKIDRDSVVGKAFTNG